MDQVQVLKRLLKMKYQHIINNFSYNVYGKMNINNLQKKFIYDSNNPIYILMKYNLSQIISYQNGQLKMHVYNDEDYKILQYAIKEIEL